MKTFEELGVSPEIRRAIEEMGYACPMPVQEEVIHTVLPLQEDILPLLRCDYLVSVPAIGHTKSLISLCRMKSAGNEAERFR